MHNVVDLFHQESSVPIAQRFLMIEGRFATSWIKTRIHRRMPAVSAQYDSKLTPDWHQAVTAYNSLQVPETSVYCAVAFAYAQLPVGKAFAMLLPAHQPTAAIYAPS